MILPPSHGRRCPEGAEVGFHSGMKRNVRKAVSRIVIPSGAEGSFSFAIFCFLRESLCMKHRDVKFYGVRCFPLAALLTSFV